MAKLGKKDIVKRVAKKAGMSIENAGKFLDVFVCEVQKALTQGDVVELKGFMKFYCDDLAPKSIVNSQTGEHTVTPVKRTVRASLSKSFKDAVAGNSEVRGIGIVLATTQEDEFAGAVSSALASKGIKCVIEATLKAAVDALGGRAKAADFVVVTPSIPEKDFEGVVIDIKSKKTTAFLPVLRGAFDVSRYTQPDGFKILPDHIFSSSSEVVRQILGDFERWHEEKHYFKRQFNLKASSDMETINQLFAAFDKLAGRVLPKAEENYKMLSALHEAIENAAQHGNKGARDKYVDVQWIEDKKNVRITVGDEGDGFDYSQALGAASLDSADAVRQHMAKGTGTGGLGVKLIKEVFDDVKYSNGGRRLELIKALRTKAGA